MRKFFSTILGLGLSVFSLSGEAETKRDDLFVNTDVALYRAQLINSTFYQNPQSSFNNAMLWLPIWQKPDRVFYLQLNQLNRFNSLHNTGANLGFRWLNTDQSWLFGVHTGYSTQNNTTHLDYQQANFGAEVRTQDWHAYGNLYVPLNNAQRNTTLDYWVANSRNNAHGFYNIFSKQNTETALTGGDLNLGYTFWQAANARFYVGGYYYVASGVNTMSGPRAQLQVDLYNAFDRLGHSKILNRISFEAMVQHDNVYKTNWYSGLTFAFTLGKQQSLSGLQRYMQVEIPQSYDRVIRSNDAVDPKVFNNADGSPLTVGYADDVASLHNAVNNKATIVAVRGSLQNLDTVTLQDDQVLTGGNYQLSNGVTLALGKKGQLIAASGQDLIQVGKNNRIENITLAADSNQHVIVKDLQTSYGTLTINNVTANAGVNLKIADGSKTANLLFTNNTFNMGKVSDQRALQVTLNAGTGQFDISNNIFIFGEGDSNQGIALTSDIIGDDRTFNIDAINNNVIQFADGAQNAGIRLNVVDDTGFTGTMTLRSMQNNQINFATGNNNYALNANVSSLSANGLMALNNMINNHVSYIAGNNNTAFFISAGYTIGNGTVVINTVNSNRVSLPSDATNQGFQLAAGDDPSDSIIVMVNTGDEGLSAANNNMSVVTAGHVTLNPKA
ncbi:MAG: hypothetical protein EXR81_05295 [Gammaproteobacteria bacterium]|nr:hypothetical protein [Gammaproteobacteria bacterium]